ncbi:MAG: nucleotidyl transferase AbiEii/AbiGii toxin family protein [Treponema sp.]|nr:nucleotidyl transferase AbiEii/AbiGii toxin family protein [Treponema sp.]
MKKMNAMSLKAKIRNIAKAKGISAQLVLQNYFFERFLDRLSRSEYREKFILKGGLLIAAMAGLDARSTMDMDATIRSLPLDEEHIRTAISAVCSISADDGIDFKITGITFIREDDEYGGFRVSINANYENINAPLSIDITTGDVITPKPVKRLFRSIFHDAIQFKLWSYNTETILAEKVETILRRSVGNTRPRDFYDVYLITKTQLFDRSIFHRALSATSAHRKTTEKISNVPEILKAIEESPILKNQWEKYRREYSYARDITFEDTIKAVKDLI